MAGQRTYRLQKHGAAGDRQAVPAVLPGPEHPTPDSLNRLTHEYGLKDDLDRAWAARPLELMRERGQTILVLKDPGGEPLDRLIGPPMEIGTFLRLAVALSAALRQLHERGLVHKDIKPTNNILVNSATGQACPLPRHQAALVARGRTIPTDRTGSCGFRRHSMRGTDDRSRRERRGCKCR